MNNTNKGLYILLLVMGVINSVMIFINGLLAEQTNLYLGGLIVHVVGFIPAIILFIMFDRDKANLWKDTFSKEKRLFLSGFIGAVLLVISAFCINNAGVFITSIAMVAGQFIISLLVDLKGYFEFKKVKLTYRKIIAMAMIAAGVVLISI